MLFCYYVTDMLFCYYVTDMLFCYYVTDMFGGLWSVRRVNMETLNVLETLQSYSNS